MLPAYGTLDAGIRHTAITGSSAVTAGGVFAQGQGLSLDIRDSVISDNEAVSTAAATTGIGGRLLNDAGTVTLRRVE